MVDNANLTVMGCLEFSKSKNLRALIAHKTQRQRQVS
jgi:hypothetical protein